MDASYYRLPKEARTSSRFVAWVRVWGPNHRTAWRVLCETDDLDEAYAAAMETPGETELWDSEKKVKIRIEAF